MKHEEYRQLEERACAVGLGNDADLFRLYCLIQARDVARKHFEKYQEEMDNWERVLARGIKNRTLVVEGTVAK